MQHPRSTFDECVNFISSELDAACRDLDEWYTNGRMTNHYHGAEVTPLNMQQVC